VLLFFSQERRRLYCLLPLIGSSFNFTVILHLSFNVCCKVLKVIVTPFRGVHVHFNIADHAGGRVYLALTMQFEITDFSFSTRTIPRYDLKKVVLEFSGVLIDSASG